MMCHWSTRCQKSKCRAVDDQRRLIVRDLSLTHRHRHQMALLSTTSSHRHSLPHNNKQQSANINELATPMPSSYWFPSSSSSSSSSPQRRHQSPEWTILIHNIASGRPGWGDIVNQNLLSHGLRTFWILQHLPVFQASDHLAWSHNFWKAVAQLVLTAVNSHLSYLDWYLLSLSRHKLLYIILYSDEKWHFVKPSTIVPSASKRRGTLSCPICETSPNTRPS